MAVKLSENEKALFTEAKAFSLEKIAPYADQWENGEKTSGEAMNLFVENGYCSLGVSKDLGGSGRSFLECALIYEGLAHGDGAIPSSIIQLHNNIVYLLARHRDSNEAIREIFPDLVSGHKRLAFAITEKHSGSDPSSMNSYAILRNDCYYVYGEKAWIFNALESDHFVITVKNGSPDAKQMIMLWVDRDTPGFTIGEDIPRLGNNCISCCNLYFDGCAVSKNRVISEKGLSEALSFIDLPRIFVPSIAIGMAQRVIDITKKYFCTAESDGNINNLKNIVPWTLFKLSAQIEAGRWLVYRTASKMDQSVSVKVPSAMNKFFATQIAMDTITRCLQLFGEKGFDKIRVLSRYMDIAKLLQIVDGTSEIQKIVIGRHLEQQYDSMECIVSPSISLT